MTQQSYMVGTGNAGGPATFGEAIAAACASSGMPFNKMKIQRAAMIAAARAYLDTPFRHQGRVKGHGIDCVGLQVCSLRDVGFIVKDHRAYGRRPDGHTLEELMRENCDELKGVALQDVVPGDIMEFSWISAKWPHHVALRTDVGILHACSDMGRVVEHELQEPWRSKFTRAWKFKGLEN